jgi:hypothetical protein
MSNLIGFKLDPQLVSLDDILPSRAQHKGIEKTRKFLQIKASIQEVGLIEPLSLSPNQINKKHVLLDGHLRLLALKELGVATAPCLIALDDESYTYNNRINRLSTIQEHKMIQRAIEKGVSAEKLARALNLDVKSVLKKFNNLDGVCPEALDMLKNRIFSPKVFSILKKMKPTRQIDCVSLMVDSNIVNAKYAEALLASTLEDFLVEKKKITRKALSPEQMHKMEREMSNINAQYKMISEHYGADSIDLVVSKGYLKKLLDSLPVYKYLNEYHHDILNQFQIILNDTDGSQ